MPPMQTPKIVSLYFNDSQDRVAFLKTGKDTSRLILSEVMNDSGIRIDVLDKEHNLVHSGSRQGVQKWLRDNHYEYLVGSKSVFVRVLPAAKQPLWRRILTNWGWLRSPGSGTIEFDKVKHAHHGTSADRSFDQVRRQDMGAGRSHIVPARPNPQGVVVAAGAGSGPTPIRTDGDAVPSVGSAGGVGGKE